MLSDEEKRELKELINLMYNNHISQYGKRKLEKYIKKQSKEIEEAEQKERKAYIKGTNDADELCNKKWEDKIKEICQKKRNQIFSCSYVDEKQWKPFDRAIDAINDLEQSLLEKE